MHTHSPTIFSRNGVAGEKIKAPGGGQQLRFLYKGGAYYWASKASKDKLNKEVV